MEQNLYKTYSRTPDFKNYMKNLDNFRQAVESPMSWNSMGYICLITTFLCVKHYLQIYLTLLSTDLWFWKMTWGIWQIFSRALKIGILMRSFNQNLKKYELKIHKGFICHDYEELHKISRGTDLSFQSWHKEFGKFWPKHSKV